MPSWDKCISTRKLERTGSLVTYDSAHILLTKTEVGGTAFFDLTLFEHTFFWHNAENTTYSLPPYIIVWSPFKKTCWAAEVHFL